VDVFFSEHSVYCTLADGRGKCPTLPKRERNNVRDRKMSGEYVKGEMPGSQINKLRKARNLKLWTDDQDLIEHGDNVVPLKYNIPKTLNTALKRSKLKLTNQT